MRLETGRGTMLEEDMPRALPREIRAPFDMGYTGCFYANQIAAAFEKDYTAWIWMDKGVLRRV